MRLARRSLCEPNSKECQPWRDGQCPFSQFEMCQLAVRIHELLDGIRCLRIPRASILRIMPSCTEYLLRQWELVFVFRSTHADIHAMIWCDEQIDLIRLELVHLALVIIRLYLDWILVNQFVLYERSDLVFLGEMCDRNPTVLQSEDIVIGTVATKLVPNGWHTRVPDANLAKRVAISVDVREILVLVTVSVNISHLIILQSNARVLVDDCRIDLLRHAFPDDYIPRIHRCIFLYESIGLELVVVERTYDLRVVMAWLDKEFFLAIGMVAVVLFFVCSVIRTLEETTIDSRLVHDDRVLLVESGHTSDGNDCIHTTRHVTCAHEL